MSEVRQHENRTCQFLGLQIGEGEKLLDEMGFTVSVPIGDRRWGNLVHIGCIGTAKLTSRLRSRE